MEMLAGLGLAVVSLVMGGGIVGAICYVLDQL